MNRLRDKKIRRKKQIKITSRNFLTLENKITINLIEGRSTLFICPQRYLGVYFSKLISFDYFLLILKNKICTY